MADVFRGRSARRWLPVGCVLRRGRRACRWVGAGECDRFERREAVQVKLGARWDRSWKESRSPAVKGSQLELEPARRRPVSTTNFSSLASKYACRAHTHPAPTSDVPQPRAGPTSSSEWQPPASLCPASDLPNSRNSGAIKLSASECQTTRAAWSAWTTRTRRRSFPVAQTSRRVTRVRLRWAAGGLIDSHCSSTEVVKFGKRARSDSPYSPEERELTVPALKKRKPRKLHKVDSRIPIL